MRQILYRLTIFALIFLTSCGQAEQQTTNQIDEQKVHSPNPTIKSELIDYKSDTYKISIGDNYKLSDKIIDWHWDAMADDDGIIDSTGMDAFKYLGEPLINYNEGEWLPALRISTDKNIITSFTCSVLFNLEENPLAVASFLRLLSNDIKQLKNDEIVKSLGTKGFYEINNADYVETFELKKGKEYEHDKFAYTIKVRQKNGR